MNAVISPKAYSMMNRLLYSIPAKAASRTRSLDQKPLKGGMPAIDRQPISITREVILSFLESPPMSRMSSVCTAWMTAPADRNSSALKKAWFMRWKVPAA